MGFYCSSENYFLFITEAHQDKPSSPDTLSRVVTTKTVNPQLRRLKVLISSLHKGCSFPLHTQWWSGFWSSQGLQGLHQPGMSLWCLTLFAWATQTQSCWRPALRRAGEPGSVPVMGLSSPCLLLFGTQQLSIDASLRTLYAFHLMTVTGLANMGSCRISDGDIFPQK